MRSMLSIDLIDVITSKKKKRSDSFLTELVNVTLYELCALLYGLLVLVKPNVFLRNFHYYYSLKHTFCTVKEFLLKLRFTLQLFLCFLIYLMIIYLMIIYFSRKLFIYVRIFSKAFCEYVRA